MRKGLNMRDFLDTILNYLGATSLTNDEFDSVTATVQAYDQASYDDLARILTERESMSDTLDRLLYLYKSKGFTPNEYDDGGSNIFVGAPLG
jgi:hypothetical protein